MCGFIPDSGLDIGNRMVRASKMAHQVKVLAAKQIKAKPGDLS